MQHGRDEVGLEEARRIAGGQGFGCFLLEFSTVICSDSKQTHTWAMVGDSSSVVDRQSVVRVDPLVALHNTHRPAEPPALPAPSGTSATHHNNTDTQSITRAFCPPTHWQKCLWLARLGLCFAGGLSLFISLSFSHSERCGTLYFRFQLTYIPP